VIVGYISLLFTLHYITLQCAAARVVACIWTRRIASELLLQLLLQQLKVSCISACELHRRTVLVFDNYSVLLSNDAV